MAVYIGHKECQAIYVARNGQQLQVSSVWVGDQQVFPSGQGGFILRVGVISGSANGPLREWAVSIGKTYQTITEITVPMEVVGPSLLSLFFSCQALTTVPALDTSRVTDMRNMFSGCQALTSVPALDTSRVTSTNNMFIGCSSLESVTLPGMGNAFTTAQTLDMRETKFNAAAANVLMQSLGTPSPGGTLQLPSTAAGADTSVATAKNWTVTIA